MTPEGRVTIVQPNDPALVTFEYLSGPGANISRVTLEGESFNMGATTGPGQLHAYASVFNPALDQLGDNGNTSVIEWSSTATIDSNTFIDGAPVTQTGQAGGNQSQMVGFTEYAATTTGGQTVHVYVQNAIQNAGHVAHH